ncbi:MAG: hypothetical protein JOY71_08360 [Acetobacteraceae bacterium]|nr:hypothetical protein [Acetobacteraceae bacterium]
MAKPTDEQIIAHLYYVAEEARAAEDHYLADHFMEQVYLGLDMLQRDQDTLAPTTPTGPLVERNAQVSPEISNLEHPANARNHGRPATAISAP